MGKKETTIKGKSKSVCLCCGEEKPKTLWFYVSHSELYKHNEGRHTICKDCVVNKYNQLISLYADEKMALYHLCLILDVYYNNDLCDSAYTQAMTGGTGSLVKVYFQKVNSLYQYKGKSSIDSEKFRGEFGYVPKEDASENEDVLNLEDDTGIVVDSVIVRRWGSGMTHDDYVFLESKYLEFIDSYAHDTPAEKLLFEQLSKTLLEAEKARKTGDRNGYEKMSKLVSSMLADANIKPSQKKVIGEEEGETFGVFIKNIEINEPVPEPLKEFEDVDKIARYIDKYFVKTFAKVFGLADMRDKVGESCDEDKN